MGIESFGSDQSKTGEPLSWEGSKADWSITQKVGLDS